MRLKSIFPSAISIISLSATVFFAVANVASADSYETADNVSSISVAVKDDLLDSSDIKTRYVVNENGELSTQSYYDIYSYDNLTLSVSYLSGETVSYSGTEISSLTAKAGIPFIISDNQQESEWTEGRYTVTCSFAGKTAQIDFTVGEHNISSVTVTPQHEISFMQDLDATVKTVITENGDVAEIKEYPFSDCHYTININYRDGSTARYTVSELLRETDHTLSFAQPDGELSVGTHTASCYVDGIKADFSFAITENTIKGISLYMTDGADVLDFSENGNTDYDKNGNPYPRFFIDKSKIRAIITYTDSTTKDISLSQLCILLDDRLIFSENQADNPFDSTTETVSCTIRNIPCSLVLDINTVSVSKITAQNIKSDSAELVWDRVYCAGYELMQYKDGEWQTVRDLPFGSEKITFDSLTSSTEYIYGVRSYTIGEEGEKIYTDVAQTSFVTSVMTVSGFKTASTTKNSVTVKWNKSADADGYIINRYENGKWVRLVNINSADTCTYTITGLNPGEEQKLYIKAFRTEGSKKYYSSQKTLYTLSNPEKVSSLQSTKSDSASVTLSWDESEDVDGYIVNIYKNGAWEKIAKLYGTDNTSYTVKGLSSGTAYKLYVKAFKKYGGYTNYSSATQITAYTLPGIVSGFKTASSTQNSVTIKWNQSNDADGYIINRYENGKWVRLANIDSADICTYTITGLEAGEEQKLYIKAFRKVKSKKYYSSQKTLYTLSNPEIVSSLQSTKSDSASVTLSWDESEDVDGYIVNMYIDGSWQKLMRLNGSDSTTAVIKELSPDTEYKLYVKAFKKYGGYIAYSSASKITVRTSV